MSRVRNPQNPYHQHHIEWEDPPIARLEVIEDDTQTILSRNESPDIPFRWSVNPYRGCTHACAYCYARPSHQHLDLGAGSDFDRKIVVKRRAPELLSRALHKGSWGGEQIVFSGNTDCYQPIERRFELTRGCLEVCVRFHNPVGIITKSPLILRDLDLLKELHQGASVSVNLSVPFLDAAVSQAIEPGTAPPKARMGAIAALAEAQIPVGVMVAPVIPGLNDREIPTILKEARAAGARWAGMTALRLPAPVDVVFAQRIEQALPGRAQAVLRQITASGVSETARFGDRMKGRGPRWQVIRGLFHQWHARLGFDAGPPVPQDTFRRPGQGKQLTLLG